MTPEPSAPEPVDTTTEIETPEHVRFRYYVAGPARRSFAYFLDALVRAGILGIVFLLAGIGGAAGPDTLAKATTGFSLVVLFVVEWGYYLFFETLWSGRTPGKRALRLRVVTEGGHPLRFTDSLLRNLLRAADFLPAAYAIGLVVMGRDARFRRLGDLAAGTIVVVEELRVVEAPFRLDPAPTPAELHPIPQQLPLSGDEIDAITLFLRRAGRLPPARAHELGELVAPIFARRLGMRYKDAIRFLGLLQHRAHERLPRSPRGV